MKGDRYPAEAGVSRSLRRRGVSASDPSLTLVPLLGYIPLVRRRRRAFALERVDDVGARVARARHLRRRLPRDVPRRERLGARLRERARRVRDAVRERPFEVRSKSVRSPVEFRLRNRPRGGGEVRGRVPRVVGADARRRRPRGAPRGRPSPPRRRRRGEGVRPSKSRAEAIEAGSKSFEAVRRSSEKGDVVIFVDANNKSPARNSASAARADPPFPTATVERRAPPRVAREDRARVRADERRDRVGVVPRALRQVERRVPVRVGTERGEAPRF